MPNLMTRQLSEAIKPGKTLLYLASGTYTEGYKELPFDNAILVDTSFKSINSEGNLITLKADAVEAVCLLQNIGVKIDTFVCINEGLSEGGGVYAINSNWFIGLLMPLLKENYVHISCPSYYGSGCWRKYTNIPFERETIEPNHASYVDPKMFSYCWGERSTVEVRSKIVSPPKILQFDNVEVAIHRKSIWEDYEKLDKLFVRATNDEKKRVSKLFPKATSMTDSFDNILNDCGTKGFSDIGFVPWLRGEYNGVIETVKNYKGVQIKVNFYHLNKNDFRQLYLL